jgi:hypothetical protein
MEKDAWMRAFATVPLVNLHGGHDHGNRCHSAIFDWRLSQHCPS